MHSSDHSIPVGYRSPGRTLHLQHPSCCVFLSPLSYCAHLGFTSPAFTYSLHHLINHSFARSLPSGWPCFPPTVADPVRGWRAGKSLWRWMCAVRCSALSRRMMERLASLWCSSSCFTIWLIYSGPLECNQHSTGEQIAVKAEHSLCHLMTRLSESLIHAKHIPHSPFISSESSLLK